MPNISPAQLAEGARLLAAMTPGEWSFGDGAIHSEDSSGGAWVPSYTDDLGEVSNLALADGLAIEWLIVNRVALLASAQRVAEVEGCVREMVKSNQSMQDAAVMCMETDGAHWLSKNLEAIRDLASRHNIDLSEPTPAGEAKRGATTGE